MRCQCCESKARRPSANHTLVIIPRLPVIQILWLRYIIITDGRRDRETDRQLAVAGLRFALRPSRGKKNPYDEPRSHALLWSARVQDFASLSGPWQICS